MFSRMPPIASDDLTPEQREGVARFRAARGSEPFGPFVPLVRSPELLIRVSALGEYVRFRSALPPRLSEFAILVTAAHWRESYEWGVHSRIALKAGVAPATLEAIGEGRRPSGVPDDEAALYDLCRAVHERRPVPADVFDRAVGVLGEHAVVDAVGLCGYYAMLAMVLHASSAEPPGGEPEFRVPVR